MPRQRTVKVCKKCGVQFYWKKFGNSWRPSDAAGNLHVCNGNAAPIIPGNANPDAPAVDWIDGYPAAGEELEPADPADAGAAIWRLVSGHARKAIEMHSAPIDTAKLEALITAAAQRLSSEVSPIIVEALGENEPKAIIEDAHYQTAALIKLLRRPGLNVMIVGPTQAGKTHACEDAAKALGLTFYALSVGPQTSKTDLLGYMDAHGRYVTTAFREAFEKGGLFLLDEMDAGNAAVLTILNAATSNGHCSFPDAPAGIRKHADFRCVAAANTWGNGADRQYVGRNQMDKATLKRFVKVEWTYDEKLERKLAGNAEWCDYIHALRRAQESTGVREVFSTRDVMTGAQMLADGWQRSDVEQMVLWSGMSSDDRAKLEAAYNSRKAAA